MSLDLLLFRTYGVRERQRPLIHSATLLRVCHLGSSSRSRRSSVEHASASLKCFQKTAEQEEAFKRAAKQLTARSSASELSNTPRASVIMDCRRFKSDNELGNNVKPALADIGSGQRSRSVKGVMERRRIQTFEKSYQTFYQPQCHADVDFGAMRPNVEV